MSFHYRVICPECRELRIKSPSGAVCPNGHGRLQSGVTESDLRKGAEILFARTLPEMEKVNARRYRLGDQDYHVTYFRWSKSGGSKVYKAAPGSVAPKDRILGRNELGEARCFKLVPSKPELSEVGS